ncbi:MAG: TA system VapC family ribonuclease toxin [Acidimicrobiales bacterium]
MRSLLDVNVLIALFDRQHIDHRRARAWLSAEMGQGWSSCAITQNGFVRVVSQAGYPNPVTPSEAIDLLEGATVQRHHRFWTCDLSLLDASVIDRSRLHGPRQVTDAYLLALATKHQGRLVTFDQKIAVAAVIGAAKANLVVIE